MTTCRWCSTARWEFSGWLRIRRSADGRRTEYSDDDPIGNPRMGSNPTGVLRFARWPSKKEEGLGLTFRHRDTNPHIPGRSGEGRVS